MFDYWHSCIRTPSAFHQTHTHTHVSGDAHLAICVLSDLSTILKVWTHSSLDVQVSVC